MIIVIPAQKYNTVWSLVRPIQSIKKLVSSSPTISEVELTKISSGSSVSNSNIVVAIIIPLYSNEHVVVDDDDVEYTLLTYSTIPLYEKAKVDHISHNGMVRLVMMR